MIQGINRERLYQDEHNRDNNLIISSSLHHSWFQFFTLVLYFSALCLVLGMTSLTHTSDVLISWRFEKSCLLLANGRFRSQGTGVWSRPFFIPFLWHPTSVCVRNIRHTLIISISFCHSDLLFTSRFGKLPEIGASMS